MTLGLTLDLPLIWAGLIAFAVLAYVILDGFDLGIGILFPLVRNRRERDVMINTVAPVWDGNETWLILGGGGLYATFPLAYAVILPALYAPLTAMLLALVFRGVAFEFRFRSERHQGFWDVAFAGGSIVATACQGLALGALIQGIEVEGRAYAGGWWDWLTPFSLLTALAMVVGYALLGATWLIYKTGGALQARFRHLAFFLGAGILGLIALVSLWTPFLAPHFAERWFSWPNIAFLSPVPLLVLGAAICFFRALAAKSDAQPFLWSLALFVISYAGLGISLFPYVVPNAFTIWQAAAPDSSLGFLLVGAVVLLPMILAYTGYAYWVFRGKVGEADHYH